MSLRFLQHTDFGGKEFVLEPLEDVEKVAVVVGGGIIGLASALELLARHCKVVHVEQESGVAKGATGAASGLIVPQFCLCEFSNALC